VDASRGSVRPVWALLLGLALLLMARGVLLVLAGIVAAPPLALIRLCDSGGANAG